MFHKLLRNHQRFFITKVQSYINWENSYKVINVTWCFECEKQLLQSPLLHTFQTSENLVKLCLLWVKQPAWELKRYPPAEVE